MSMVQMPLLIKVKMTKENYAALIAEAMMRYFRIYLKKHYLYDGTYFTLDVCDMDNYEIFSEAAMIARFAEPTNETVGLIYDGGCSFSVSELKFINGCCFPEKKSDKQTTGGYEAYMKKKEAFLNRFSSEVMKKPPECAADMNAFPPVNEVREYKCLGMHYDTLDYFFEQRGYHVEEIFRERGCISVSLKNSEEKPEDILAHYYGCDKAILFAETDYQNFPDHVMLLLIKNKNNAATGIVSGAIKKMKDVCW